MDGARFDAMTRALAARPTRRGLLGGLAGLAAGMLGVRVGEAACGPEQVNRRGTCVCKTTARPPGADGRCPCASGLTRCGDGCVALSRDVAHCGACGHACPTGANVAAMVCRQGACRIGSCAAGWASCDGDAASGCETALGTAANCGACGVACATSQECVEGQCACTAVSCPTGCCDGDGTCRIDDDTACGTGGGDCLVCTAPETCGGGEVEGVCGCTDDETACGVASCGTATNNCEAEVSCGPLAGACPQEPGQVCDGGVCVCTAASCPDGCCDDDVCRIDDSAACGSGGGGCVACPTGQECDGGQCVCTPASCPTGCCDGDGLCRIDDDAACGTGGGACAACVAPATCGGVELGACGIPAPGQGTCNAGVSDCAVSSVHCNGSDQCDCLLTAVGLTFCGHFFVEGDDFDCQACTTDAECAGRGPEARCVVLGGTCVVCSATERACMDPCPFEP